MGEINTLIHQPVRLRIMAALFAMDRDGELDFTFLRDELELTDGNLGAHLEKLEAAGYLKVRKTFIRKRPRTYVGLTRAGRGAFEDYLETLKAVLNDPSVGRE